MRPLRAFSSVLLASLALLSACGDDDPAPADNAAGAAQAGSGGSGGSQSGAGSGGAGSGQGSAGAGGAGSGGAGAGGAGSGGEAGAGAGGAGAGGEAGGAAGGGAAGEGGAAGTPACDGKAALACDAPAVCGEGVPILQVASDAPAMNKGAVKDGVYVLTKYTKYTGPGGSTTTVPAKIQMIMVIAGSDIRGAVSTGGDPKGYRGALDISGGLFKVDNVCPSASPDDDPDPYTATDDEIRVLSGSKDNEELVYTRVGDAPAGAGGSGGGAGSGGAGGSGGAAAGSGGGACNDLDLAGAPEVTTKTASGATPAMTGGSLPEGTYHLTEFTFYNMNPTLAKVKQVGQIKGSLPSLTFDSAISEDGGAVKHFTNSVAVDVAKSLLTEKTTCGDDYSIIASYKVVDVGGKTELHAVVGPFPNGGSLFEVYQKQ